MSDRNETTVRRLMDEVWCKGNVKLIDEFYAKDQESNDPVDPTRGIEAERNHVMKYRNAFPDCRLDIDELFSVGDKVVCRWHYSGTHRNDLEGIPATGRRVTGPGISIYHFRNDKIQETYNVWDALTLMQQLGVVSLPGRFKAAGA